MCDFQLFIIGVLVCHLVKKNEKHGTAVILIFLVASIILSGAYIAYKNLPVLTSFQDDFLRAARDITFLSMYFVTHLRFSAYMVGMLGGRVSHHLTQKKITISQRTTTLGLLLSAAIIVLCLLSPFVYGSEYPYSAARAAVYGSLLRPLWCVASVIITLIVELTTNHKVAAFASLRIWGPISRLSFSLYLTHMIVLFPHMGSQIEPFVLGVSSILLRIFVDIVLSVLLALVVYLCLERPIYGLFVITMAKLRKLEKPKLQ